MTMRMGMQVGRVRAAWLAGLLGLVGCQPAPGTGTSSVPVRVGQPPAAVAASAAFEATADLALTRTLQVDVDPLHGAAFERPARELAAVAVSRSLKLLAEFPQVAHDPATGRTTVTLALTNAGDSLNFLACRVSGDRPVVSPAYQWNTTVSRAGQSQTQALIFENPSGAGFTMTLTFTGIMPATGVVSAGAATALPSAPPSASPSPGATATPAASPVPTAPPTPSATPVPSPAGSPGVGGWRATASSSYGALEPGRAIDGDASSQWANDGYRAPSAWLAVDTGASRALGTVGVKMVPQSGGGSYRLEVSEDGRTWTPVTGPLRNASWAVEPKALPAGTRGRHLRLAFTNDAAAPETRFSVYEVQVDGLAAPAPAPSATPTGTPTASPSTGAALAWREDFEGFALNARPTDWVDPNDEGFRYDWMPRVDWRVTSQGASKQFLHDGLASQPWLNFRRYRGAGMGTPNGALPDRYFAEVEVTPLESTTYAPTGDQGTQVYYQNPTNYVELLIKPTMLEVWSAIGAQPFQSNGWTRLYYMNATTAAGQPRKLGAEVDARAGTIKVYFDGVPHATIASSAIHPEPHWLALRGTGNRVTHDNVRVEPR